MQEPYEMDDKITNKIVLARDRIGVKPLFYLNNEDYFIVSSEAKVIDYIKCNNKLLNLIK